MITVAAFAVSSRLKLVVREALPCQSLHVTALEACPAPGDWSFPSNHHPRGGGGRRAAVRLAAAGQRSSGSSEHRRQTMPYDRTGGTFEVTVEPVRREPADQGFGILSEIDVPARLKAKPATTWSLT
ncbi:hypothetical protein [Streptomyces sp. P9-A4]|uniref:hypothetical protein n=1 Tax=Streptomyces sp. P9-A4 TaxID=3072285 RepID=UPI003FCC336E